MPEWKRVTKKCHSIARMHPALDNVQAFSLTGLILFDALFVLYPQRDYRIYHMPSLKATDGGAAYSITQELDNATVLVTGGLLA